MAVTHSRAAERQRDGFQPGRRNGWRVRELACTLAACLLVAAGLWQVARAKAPVLDAAERGLAARQLINLNELGAREDLLPMLGVVPDPAERELVARKIYYLGGGLANVGAIGRLRVSAAELRGARGLAGLRARLGGRDDEPLLSAAQVREIKPLLVVRRPAQFRAALRLWVVLFFFAVLAVNVWLSLRGFGGDQTLLPAAVLMAGLGLVLMLGLRDPVRDNMLFVDFAQGVVGGCVVLAVAASLDYRRLTGNLSFVPLLASFVLSALLIVFGSGPGTSDAKVNLLGFQPVEIIRILLVFFLAGWFARRWDVLRHARERRPTVAAITRRFDIPPLEYTAPALISVALSLVFFFLQKDMGPALVFACLFLALYGIARASALVPAAGVLLLLAGFAGGYLAGVPRTVGQRVAMWVSPWDNAVHGGDQVAQALWAFSTGGPAGLGLGQGDPGLVPAAHTDLILSAAGEELGFLGVALVFALFGWVVYRAFRIALRARGDYEFFLAAGLGAATALQVLLISGGSLGVLPLTGVVTPFLSYGRSAMLANFLVIGILLAISSRTGDEGHSEPFRLPVRAAVLVFAAVAVVIVGRAGYVQLANSAAVMGRGALVTQADGARRFQYNPRFQEVMRSIPKGTIFDRNGLPLATSNWADLEGHRAEYRELGIDIDRACPRSDTRWYPFGGLLFDLLGDLRTRTRWGAGNTSFVERDSARRLRGYDDRPTLMEVKNPASGQMERVIRYDYRELVPLLRHRNEPDNPEVRRILDRPRDVRMSIDARLQVKVAEILSNQLRSAGQDKGAAVVLDAATGDLLASVSEPVPPATAEPAAEPGTDAPNPFLDRARYGLYPPGSTFKVVTAMAALRKDPALAGKRFECVRLPDGRVGNFVGRSRRPIRDDVQDKTPHGTLDMERGLVVSCNAYFAQLGTLEVGAEGLLSTAGLLGIAAASPATAGQLRESLPQSSYGQGQVVASPFQMARVAATVANGGAMPQGRWIADETNPRTAAPASVLPPESAATLGRFMREVVTSGTGRRAGASVLPLAGKTGTAELATAPSHAWFIGFAPYGGSGRKIAISVLVENGVYGGTNAAPGAAEIVNAAARLGLIRP